MSGFSSGTIQARREWSDILECNENIILESLDLTKLPFRIEKEQR